MSLYVEVDPMFNPWTRITPSGHKKVAPFGNVSEPMERFHKHIPIRLSPRASASDTVPESVVNVPVMPNPPIQRTRRLSPTF